MGATLLHQQRGGGTEGDELIYEFLSGAKKNLHNGATAGGFGQTSSSVPVRRWQQVEQEQVQQVN